MLRAMGIALGLGTMAAPAIGSKPLIENEKAATAAGADTVNLFTAEIILALLAVLTALGGGIKYVLSRMDAGITAERVRADAAQQAYKLDLETSRTRYEDLVQSQIAELRAEIALQDRKIEMQARQLATQNRYIDYLTDVADAHRRHISALESLMIAAGMSIPALHLPERPASLDMIGDNR